MVSKSNYNFVSTLVMIARDLIKLIRSISTRFITNSVIIRVVKLQSFALKTTWCLILGCGFQAEYTTTYFDVSHMQRSGSYVSIKNPCDLFAA